MYRGSLFLGRDPGGPTLGVVPGDGATPEGGIWGPGRPSRQTWGGRRLAHVGGTGGLRSPVKAGTTQVGDPGGWSAPGQERGVALSSAGAPFYSTRLKV